MRKWRGRKRRPEQGEDAASAPEPLQPAYPGMHEENQPAESVPADSESEQPQAEEAESAVAAPGEGETEPAARSVRSRRRRKKKPAATQPDSESPQTTYSEPETPRPIVALKPGGPTGEAAELEPAEPEPETPAQPSSRSGQTTTPKRASKGAVVLAVGLPGSGKTTWFKRRGVTPLSSDLLRSLLFDDPTEQRHQDLVFSSLRSLLRARLIARMPMNYVDATNLSPKERRHWIRMAHEFGYDAHAVYFDVPLEICSQRNRRRQRIVPEDVMQRMSNKLRPPTFDEGFSKIIVVRVKSTLPPTDAEPPEKHEGTESEHHEGSDSGNFEPSLSQETDATSEPGANPESRETAEPHSQVAPDESHPSMDWNSQPSTEDNSEASNDPGDVSREETPE